MVRENCLLHNLILRWHGADLVNVGIIVSGINPVGLMARTNLVLFNQVKMAQGLRDTAAPVIVGLIIGDCGDLR